VREYRFRFRSVEGVPLISHRYFHFFCATIWVITGRPSRPDRPVTFFYSVPLIMNL
jgi:hypothetical protein